jgi:hypothetical protein
LACAQDAAIEAWMDRNPVFTENNVGYQIYPSDTCNRVLLIYNLARMIDFVEKRQLNSNASGEEGLLHKPDAMAFHVDPLDQQPWMTHLQGSLNQ